MPGHFIDGRNPARSPALLRNGSARYQQARYGEGGALALPTARNSQRRAFPIGFAVKLTALLSALAGSSTNATPNASGAMPVFLRAFPHPMLPWAASPSHTQGMQTQYSTQDPTSKDSTARV